nr:MAG TPA: hypothetical protein [Caudoviricetes sp.]
MNLSLFKTRLLIVLYYLIFKAFTFKLISFFCCSLNNFKSFQQFSII